MPQDRHVSLAKLVTLCRVFVVAVVVVVSVFVLPVGSPVVQALVPPDPNFGSNGQLMLPEYGQFLDDVPDWTDDGGGSNEQWS